MCSHFIIVTVNSSWVFLKSNKKLFTENTQICAVTLQLPQSWHTADGILSNRVMCFSQRVVISVSSIDF